MKESEKLPKQIKKSIEKGKLLDKEWNENNLSSLINDCINIENNIKEINKMNDDIQKYDSNKDIKINYIVEDKKINNMINKIQNFGKVVNNTYNDYKIENRNPIIKLANHTSNIFCLCLLNDGRLVSGSSDDSIIIYNKTTYLPDLIIKEHTDSIYCIHQLSSGSLISCSGDKTIKLFNIQGMKYEILQTFKDHNNTVYKIVELKNKSLVSCSEDSSIIFYLKDNDKYQKDYQIKTEGPCYSIIQTKDNEICYSEYDKICFYDLIERKIKSSLSNINKYNGYRECFLMINKDLLLIPGNNQISLINLNEYTLIRKIDVPGSSWIIGACMLNKNMLLTGDCSKTIKQWKIEDDNLILISKREIAHDSDINVLLNMRNGFIASGSADCTIKIW